MYFSGDFSFVKPNCSYSPWASSVTKLQRRNPRSRIPHDALHQPFPQPVPAIGFEHEDVANVGVCRVIRDYAGKSHLPPLGIYSEAQRIFDGAGHKFARDALGPVALSQKAIDDIEIQPLAIGTNDELAPVIFLHLGSGYREGHTRISRY